MLYPSGPDLSICGPWRLTVWTHLCRCFVVWADRFRSEVACRDERLLLTEVSIDVKSPPQKISLHSEKELRCNG